MKIATTLLPLAISIVSMAVIIPDKKTPVAPNADPQLIWETPQELKTPESVIYDPATGMIYVSNINGKATEKDGNGFISRLTSEGAIESLEWVTGLNAPKGMGIYNNTLYVTDIDRVASIDLGRGRITGFQVIPGSSFLNDITIDGEGKVYVSDMMGGKVYMISGDEVLQLKVMERLTRPNGLAWDGERLLIGNTDYILSFNPLNNETRKIAEETGSIDGLVALDNGRFLVSDWSGNVHLITPGKPKLRLLDLESKGINAADIWYEKGKGWLFVPTFLYNNVMAFKMPPM